ncbi:ExeM/NucH family extracellular endonuclease [Vreelandella aquamarina]
MSFEAALTTLYQDFLLREPDSEGLAYWNAALSDNRLSFEEVAGQILHSDEFQSEIQPVLALYTQILQRSADPGGLQYWVSELRQGASIDAISDSMRASEEARGEVMTLDDEAWLTNAYTSLLAREPDAEGFGYWREQLDNGVSREAVSTAINASDEARALINTKAVGALLGSDTPEQALDAYLTDLLGVDAEPEEPTPDPEEPSEPETPTPEPEEPSEPESPSPEPPEPEEPSEPEEPEEPSEPSEPEAPGLENPSLGLDERYHVGTSDASTAIAVGERLMLVADDEDQVLRLYDRDADGEPLASVNLNDALGLNDTQEADLEAVATLDGVQYWLGSHESAQRSMLFATQVSGDDADTLSIDVQGQFTDLAAQLQTWDANDGHGLGAGAKALADGINIEGAAFVGDTLMLGLRAPLDNGMAQVIPVNNVPALVAGDATDAAFGAPLRLDMEGRVIRAIEPAGNGSFLVLAGPENDDGEEGFALYHWDGAHAVRQVEGPDLNTAPDALTAKPETLFDVQLTESGFTAGVLYDSGTVDWLDDGQESKDLPAEQQRFIGVDIEFDTLPDFAPRPGDIAITAVQTDNPDDFQFVALKGIAEGEEITFTDSGWADDGFRANEGAVTWTAPAGGVAPGTIISFAGQADQFREANGEAVGNNGLNLSGSGDQVIAFTGSPEAPTFLFAVQTSSSEWQEGGATGSNDSGLPPGLEEGVTAVAVGESVDAEYDNAAYSGTGTGTPAELLAAIADAANWSGDNTALPSVATQDFNIGTMEEVYVPGNRDIGLVISELWPGQSGSDVTEDWFEITNRSSETLDFSATPLYYDDDSADPQDAVEIQGVTELAPGESAIVMVDGNAEAVAEFRAAWSNLETIDSLKIGYAEGGSGLGGGGDAATVWLGDPRIDGDQVASAAYPDTDGFDAASWNADAGRFTSADDENALSSTALGGDGEDVPALATPGSAAEPMEPTTLISAIQGATDVSPLVDETVTVEAVVTMVTPGMDGFFLQEEDSDNDDDALTSEGIFVYTGSDSAEWLAANLDAGQQIRITGRVSEYFDKTQLSADRDSLKVLENGLTLPSSQRIEMPFTDKSALEAFEGMRVAIAALDGEPLSVTELYELGRYGEVTLSSGGRLEQFTEVNSPDVEGYSAWLDDAESRTIKIDDANSTQNPDPVIYGRNGEELSGDNPLRGGDQLAELDGVLDFSFGEWKVQNVDGLDFSGPERPASPDAEALGSPGVTVASFNVLNYFTTLDEDGNKTVTLNGTEHSPRGADNADELARQEAKLVDAINTSGADVVGLMEIENNGYAEDSAIATLVDALNADAQAKGLEGVTWAYNVPEDDEGNVTSPGDDAIAVGMIYNSEVVTPLGAAATKTDGAFESANRAPLLQTFEENASGEVFSAVVNHFKSKGSVVNDESAIGDGQANNNPTRVKAAEELRDWLASDPTDSGDSDVLIIGDLNAYAMEDPITTLAEAGYTRLNDDYSYVFDGFWGSLDHALASDSLMDQVSGTTTWHINADEASALDYNTDFTNDRQDDNLYADGAFRSSDHDPILVGLNLSDSASAGMTDLSM